MNIHEHQAKKILKNYGAKVPNGIFASNVNDLLEKAKTLATEKYVLKAQIHSGGRGKAGGIKLVNNLEELEKEAKNLIGIYSSLTGIKLEKSIEKFSGKNFSEFKDELSNEVVEKISPISNEIKKLLQNKDYLDEIVINGCEKANEISSKKITEIHKIVGF